MKASQINNSEGCETMNKKTTEAKQQDLENDIKDDEQNVSSGQHSAQVSEENDAASQQADIEVLKAELEEKSKKSDEYLSMLQRTMAEFDNYKKRTAKEKEGIFSDAVCDTASHFLTVLDNLERAVDSCKEGADAGKLLEGVEMVLKQFKDSLSKLGIEEIEAKGKNFDPELHNAVMHVEDEEVGESIVLEEFQKGYKLKDKVIRHSMVKVAN
ncbi:nucleotide exchange factor GrpE [Petroclostridium sp. X23]|uniref:nucleotide exchange factor GrpE n=1 Tax=Petroclostridium sp. X23 TaxID=3045146 RepID=UPI0024AE5C6B|nr:nucleotide exchange factor GrpE [Petroclostridium sp. X23]WHH60428.1 nucleotide exchange factor GrpE [Petroclostridium sp. X23]